jgi:hypothetical protein
MQCLSVVPSDLDPAILEAGETAAAMTLVGLLGSEQQPQVGSAPPAGVAPWLRRLARRTAHVLARVSLHLALIEESSSILQIKHQIFDLPEDRSKR